MSSTSWRGNVQYEALHWWCGSPHFWSGSPSRLAGQAIFEGNLPFLWYWWHHSTVEPHKINRGLAECLPSPLKIRPFNKHCDMWGCTCFWICSGLLSIKFTMFALIAVRSASETLFGSSSTFEKTYHKRGIINSVHRSTRLIQQWLWSDLVINVTLYIVYPIQYDRCELWPISTGSGHNLDRLHLHTRCMSRDNNM